MPSIFACLVCGGRGESDDIRTLDYCHASLSDVPSDVFACERTLEELYLDSNQLNELPRQLFFCHGLKVLGLSDNELTSLPPAVASLINLASIDLSKNAISDIPDNIKGCKQLSVVDASINPLCRLPEGFTQLLALQELYLNDTFLEYLPANFGRLSRLRILELRENQLNTLPKSIARLTNLQRLDIGQNDFSELPEVIGSLGNLTELWFDNNKVKSLPPMLGRLRKLVHVDASKNKVDWVAGELENCVTLTDLHLSSNHLKELPEKLGGCRQLQVLKLDDNALTHLPESIGGLSALQELVVTQNDLETLPASVGLLRALHTLHVDDNLLTELPPELGSCSNLTVLTAASNRLTRVPAELGHLPRLAVLNLCENLIPHLPVSLTKLKLRALWLSENQNKPQVQLQSETLPETGQRVLTCFMLPQQPRCHQPEAVVEADTFPGQGWDEQRRAKTLIKFAFDGDVDKPGRLTRAPTPYPKELKALAKHARNLHSLQKDQGRQFVLGRSQDSNKTSSSSVVLPIKDEAENDMARKLQVNSAVDHADASGAPPVEGEEAAAPLAVLELQAEERPLLREARNVRNSHLTAASPRPGSPEGELTAGMVNGSRKAPLSAPGLAGDGPYAIGDRKVFGHAQVVTTTHPQDKVASDAGQGEEGSTVEPVASPEAVSVSAQEPLPPALEGDSSSDPHDKRIKKPPPYHIAAVMSRHAADFSEPSVEVSGRAPSTTGLTVKEIPGPQQNSTTTPVTSPAAEEENTDTSSSSDSGYGNGKVSIQHTTDDQQGSDGSSVNTPSSPQTLTDSSLSMPSTPISPLSNVNLVSSQASRPFMAPLSSGVPHRPSSLSVPPPASSLSSATSHSAINSQKPLSARQQQGGNQYPTYTVAKSSTRPASIATGTQLEPCSAGLAQRPGSLALGALADSALLNRLPHDHRPGSLAAPINTLGIPPAPTRAVSHMGLNVTSPSTLYDNSMFRSQDLSPTRRGWASDHRGPGGAAIHRQESNGLVSIIDQVTSSLLEHGDSPPPKTLTSEVITTTSSSNTPLQSAAPSVGYPQNAKLSSLNDQSRAVSAKDQAVPPVLTSSSSTHAYQGTGSFSSSTSSVGPTNFTQDQPRGEVLHPTPHRPSLLSPSGTRPTRDVLQESTMPTPDHEPCVEDGEALHSTANQGSNMLNNSIHSETTPTPQKSASKLPSRIPGRSSEAAYSGVKSPHQGPHTPSQPTVSRAETKIPTHDSRRHSPPSSVISETQAYANSRIHTPASIARSPSTQESKAPTDTRIPTLSSIGRSPSNLSYDKQVQGETRIPTLGSIGRSPSGLSKEGQHSFESQKQEHCPANESQNINDSRIPSLNFSGYSSGSLASASYSPGTKMSRLSESDVTRNATGHNRSHAPAGQSGVSGIPMLASQGRSNSNLSSSLPSPGGSAALRPEAGKHNTAYGYSSKLPNSGEAGQTASSRIQSPGYSSGIRPPSIQSPSQHPQTPRGYSSGIRPPTVNSAINTPGIPLPSPLGTPGSRGSVTSTGSASRIPQAGVAQGMPSKIPAPGSSKHRVSPSVAQSPDPTKANHSAWMFGQHKNARVVCQNFPVVIEKNPDLGFTIGQSHTDPEDKSIYVMSVTGGGAASSALKIGDKLLQVDGADLRAADLQTATSILNKTHNTVNLMVSRLQ